MPSNTVDIIAKTITMPTGEVRTVECDQRKTSRTRAEYYVKIGAAKWHDPAEQGIQDTIYFLDPAILMARNEERRDGNHGWYVGESGAGADGSFVRARSHVQGRRSSSGGGMRMWMTQGGEHSFMDSK